MTTVLATDTADEQAARRAPLIFVGIFTAVVAGLLALLLAGEVFAVIVVVLVLGVSISVASLGRSRIAKVTLAALTVALIGSIGVLGVGLAQIAAAIFADQGGPTDAADSAMLFAAESKIRASANDAGFRIELTEDELNAVLQDSLASQETPFERVTIEITNEIGDQGRIDFTGDFKSGGLSVDGILSAAVVQGSIDLQIVDIDVGMFRLPSLGRSAVEEMIERVADLEAAVVEQGADIQEITIGGHKIVITGVNRDGRTVKVDDIVASLRESIPEARVAVPRFEPGRVDGLQAPGNPIYLALGDSLAANVGVDAAELGYVSRFHSLLEARDATTYGMVNLGVPGETSGTLLNGGQLEVAEALDREVAYVTIDVGANDLLGHLGSPACNEDIVATECQERIEATLGAYERNIAEILDRIAAAFPNATVILLTTYNPFSFGLDTPFEAEGNATVTRLNTIATGAAIERGFLAADGFTPMRATVVHTTHMTDAEPDIHPTALGYDVLTGALWDGLPVIGGQ